MIRNTFLHIILLWVTCADSPPLAVSVTVQAGSSAVLPCDWRKVSSTQTFNEKPFIRWRNVSRLVFERFGKEWFQGAGYEDRVDVPEDKLLNGDCSLVFRTVSCSDEGQYQSYLIGSHESSSDKDIFIQSVSLSVEELTKKEEDKQEESNDAGVNRPEIIAVSLLLYILFQEHSEH